MKPMNESERLRKRTAAVELSPDDFRKIGHRLVDQLADFLAGLRSRAVTRGETPAAIRSAIASDRPLPELGSDPASLATDAADLLIAHSLFNGHPRFFGYITSSAMPIGAFGDFIAAVVNCNVGGVEARSGGFGDRSANDSLDCPVHRLSGGLRRAAGQRRKHG